MRGRLIHKTDLTKIVDLLRKDGYSVVAPFAGKGRDTFFDEVSDANEESIQLHLPNPYYPPKRYVFPHILKLFQITTGAEPKVEEEGEPGKVAIFGIRSCDIEGIFHQDRFFLGNAYRDTYYENLRSKVFLVNMVCTDTEKDIDDDCFCVCADSGPAARSHFDLQLMDLHDDRGEFLAIAGSPAGEALFAQPFFRKASETDIERRRKLLTEVRKRFKTATSWYSAATKFITRGAVSEATWKLIGDRCLECGGCSYVCPTCTCFTVSDRRKGPQEFERVRMWDACALSGFTRMAGGHNPRKAVHDRRNRRFFRKLGHYFIQRELTMACVGCGRCVRVCHGDIGMPAVVEILRRETAAAEAAAAEKTEKI
jgi:sulfhydrogenase subunit beta (sulfur reductase)